MTTNTATPAAQQVSNPQPGERRPLSAAVTGLCAGILLLTAQSQTAWAAPDNAASEQLAHFAIPAGSLSDALLQFSETSGQKVLFNADLVRGLSSGGLQGRFTVQQALQRLLSGSGLVPRATGSGSVTLEKSSSVEPRSSTTMPPVMVTGKNVYDATDPYNPDYSLPNASTATKTDTPIMETPFSVKVISKQVMQDQQSVRLEQALENVSGVQPNRATAGNLVGQNATMIRGFQTFDFYRDGGRFSGGWVNNGPRELANIERVEVLKGPASILYGRLEPGGMVNVVTKQPLATPYYSLQQQFGSFDFYRTTADATGPVTKDGDLLYRVNLAYENGGSFREFVDNDRVFLAPTFHWQISDKTQANAHFEYQHNSGSVDSGLFALGNRTVDLPRERNLGEAGSSVVSESFVAGFDWSHAFNDNWTLRHRFDATLIPENSGSPAVIPVLEQNCTEASCSVLRRTTAFESPADSYYTTLDLTGKFSTLGLKHTLLIGGDYQRLENQYSYKTATIFATTPIDAYNPVHTGINATLLDNPQRFGGFDLKEEWFGFYTQDQIELPHHIHLLAGFRYDDASFGSASQDTAFGNASSDSYRVHESAVKPRFGVLYQPIPEVSLYGNYVENFGINNGLNADRSPLPTTTAEQWEAGIKTELFDKRLVATLAWFDITKQNIATPDPDANLAGLGFQKAIGQVRNQGVELDVTGELLPGWKLISSYAYTDSQITKDSALVDGVITQGNQGNSLFNVPRNSGSLWTTYEFENGDFRGLKFGAGLLARDQRPGDNANSFQLPGYATVNLLTSYSMKVGKSKVTTQLNVNNLLDKSYIDSSTNFRGAGIMPGTPRSFIGSIRVQF